MSSDLLKESEYICSGSEWDQTPRRDRGFQKNRTADIRGRQQVETLMRTQVQDIPSREVQRFVFERKAAPGPRLHPEDNMDLREELLNKLHEVWIKLQGLPQASPLEQGAFAVVILFVGAFLFMIVIGCMHCCCGKPKYQASRVQPLQFT
uniref:Uncharacterized protein LOC100302390 n=1 Tax=Nothobranchius rachovii TaxID=451742 RepID=A0A1A8S2B5_9TELE